MKKTSAAASCDPADSAASPAGTTTATLRRMNTLTEAILIHLEETVEDALRKLDQNSLKLLLVTNERNDLLGTLSDGDIRRTLLKGTGLQSPIPEIFEKQPTFLREKDFSLEKAREIFITKKIQLIPVVSDRGTIVDFVTWDQAFGSAGFQKSGKPAIDAPVVIMAGGKGTRLDPFTRILPKPLIPIGDKPVIEIIIDRFREYGIDRYFISVNHKARIIKSYFEEISPDYDIQYIDEKIPLGTAGSLKYMEGKVEGSLIVTNCDIIINCDYSEIMDYHLGNNNDITLVASHKRYSIPYGICNIEQDGGLLNIEEKPEYSFLVNTGLYVLKAEMLSLIPDNEFFHMTQLIEAATQAGKKVNVFPIAEDSWIDTGEWEEYKKAVDKIKI